MKAESRKQKLNLRTGMLAQPLCNRALKSPAPRALPQECAGELTPGEALGLPDAWVRRNVRRAVALLLLCSAVAAQAVTTVTGNLLDLTGQSGLTTKISFIPDSTILINNNGLAAGPAKTITATNGVFSIVLDPQNYTVALPLISGRDPFSIAVGYNLGTVNITNCMVPPTYFTKQLNTTITGLTSNQLTTINPGQLYPQISVGSGSANSLTNLLGTNWNLIIEGDSRSSHFNSLPQTDIQWPYQFTNLPACNGATLVNVAAQGEGLSAIVSEYTAEVQPYAPVTTGKPALLVVWIGINDASTLLTNQATAATYFSNYNAYCYRAKTNGFLVVGATEYVASNNMSAQGILGTYYFNQMVRSCTNLFRVADFAGVIPDTTITNLIQDGTHPNINGYKVLANEVQATLLGKTPTGGSYANSPALQPVNDVSVNPIKSAGTTVLNTIGNDLYVEPATSGGSTFLNYHRGTGGVSVINAGGGTFLDAFYNDGSGMLAMNNINWTANGVLAVANGLNYTNGNSYTSWDGNNIKIDPETGSGSIYLGLVRGACVQIGAANSASVVAQFFPNGSGNIAAGLVSWTTAGAAIFPTITTTNLMMPTNYLAANFVPVAGMVKFCPSNNWIFSVTNLKTNPFCQINP